VEVDLGYSPKVPPEILYHGTSIKNADAIALTGIDKRTRQHVHLSKDIDTAIKVGQRHGKPYVFIVQALLMHNDGFEFLLSDNSVWLTDNVPAKYLKSTGEGINIR
jgi:putative RNA 2'-phosphotransferase